MPDGQLGFNILCPRTMEGLQGSMLDDRNSETFLHKNRSHFPERNCVVPVMQHGCHAMSLLCINNPHTCITCALIGGKQCLYQSI